MRDDPRISTRKKKRREFVCLTTPTGEPLEVESTPYQDPFDWVYRKKLNPAGDCYQDVFQFVQALAEEEIWDAVIVHGVVQPPGQRKMDHAWVEIGDHIWEPEHHVIWGRVEFYGAFGVRETWD